MQLALEPTPTNLAAAERLLRGPLPSDPYMTTDNGILDIAAGVETDSRNWSRIEPDSFGVGWDSPAATAQEMLDFLNQ